MCTHFQASVLRNRVLSIVNTNIYRCQTFNITSVYPSEYLKKYESAERLMKMSILVIRVLVKYILWIMMIGRLS